MFNPTILEKLQDLNISSITKTLNEARNIHPLTTLPINVNSPYFFATIYDETKLNEFIRSKIVLAILP